MLTSRGPFSIKKRRSTDDFQKVRHTTDYEKLVSVVYWRIRIRRSEVHVQIDIIILLVLSIWLNLSLYT